MPAEACTPMILSLLLFALVGPIMDRTLTLYIVSPPRCQYRAGRIASDVPFHIADHREQLIIDMSGDSTQTLLLAVVPTIYRDPLRRKILVDKAAP